MIFSVAVDVRRMQPAVPPDKRFGTVRPKDNDILVVAQQGARQKRVVIVFVSAVVVGGSTTNGENGSTRGDVSTAACNGTGKKQ